MLDSAERLARKNHEKEQTSYHQKNMGRFLNHDKVKV